MPPLPPPAVCFDRGVEKIALIFVSIVFKAKLVVDLNTLKRFEFVLRINPIPWDRSHSLPLLRQTLYPETTELVWSAGFRPTTRSKSPECFRRCLDDVEGGRTDCLGTVALSCLFFIPPL